MIERCPFSDGVCIPMRSKPNTAGGKRQHGRLWQRVWGLAVDAYRPQRECDSAAPMDVPTSPPGMTTQQELEYYEACAARMAARSGAVVDLGCWMGATAYALARGIVREAGQRESADSRVQAFDRFLWEPWMDPFLPDVFCDYRSGDSFLPEARKRMADMLQHVDLVPCDLTLRDWQGGPIKILLVDAMKTESLTRSITERFFPFLEPGGIVLHQDFKHYYTSWLHLVQYRLRDQLRLTHEVRDGGTVGFEVFRPVTHEDAVRAADFADATDDEVEAAFNYSLNLVEAQGQSAIAAAHVMHFVHANQFHRAGTLLDDYRHRFPAASPDLDNALAMIERPLSE